MRTNTAPPHSREGFQGHRARARWRHGGRWWCPGRQRCKVPRRELPEKTAPRAEPRGAEIWTEAMILEGVSDLEPTLQSL